MVAGWSVAEKIEPQVNKAVLGVLVGGLVGARLYHVVDLWSYYSQNWAQIVMVWHGGLGIWGGVIGGGVGLWIVSCRVKSRDPSTATRLGARQVGMTRMLGAIANGLPLAQAIGRLGNAVNGEFVNKIWILPWWSCEAILDLILFGLLFYASSRAKSRDPSTATCLGARQVGMTSVGIYLIGYGTIRFILEFWRVNNWRVGGLGVAQWVSLTSIVVGLFVCRLRDVQD